MINPAYILALLVALVFTLATLLQPQAQGWRIRSREGGLMGMLLGDGRRMFANHFIAKADEYFHSGYYPSIFDQVQKPGAGNSETPRAAQDEKHRDEKEPQPGHEGQNHADHESLAACEEKVGRWDVAQDWVARMGRNFRVTEHTHLEGTQARELLPWLRLSAELDPRQVTTYLVGSYWLRKMGKSIKT